MRKAAWIGFLLAVATLFSAYALQDKWIQVKPKSGDSIYKLLKRYEVQDSCSRQQFLKLNALKSKDMLLLGKQYKLPIAIKTYNGKSIRSTLGITDYNLAKKIQDFNLSMLKKNLRKTDYRKSKILWVPLKFTDCKENQSKVAKTKQEVVKVPLLGRGHESVKVKSQKLAGNVYYLVSGHGGPDPGAMTTHQGYTLCEDEYAYDVTLRLCKNLLEQGATVYMITRDKNDGIRDEKFLTCDKDERCYPDKKIPYNQVKRLKQRAAAVNSLYKKHKRTAKKQRCIVIHVDSRSKREQIDVFFYHYKHSKTGKKLANTIRNTFESKYAEHQKGRGYKGEVSYRNLYMLTKTLPVTCYIELGNIQHERDRKRVELSNNRQALANWLTEALIK